MVVEGSAEVFALEPGDLGASWTVAVTRATAAEVLFGADGVPNIEAIKQGQIADCYFLAAIGGLAGADPEVIQQRVYWDVQGWAVRFDNTWVHVANDFSVALQARTDELWPVVMEKAYAFYRTYSAGATGASATSLNTLASLGWGNETVVARQLGQATSTYYVGLPYGLNTLLQRATAGGFLTLDTQSTATTLVPSHVYIVTGITWASDGSWSLQTYNPWGFAVEISSSLIAQEVTRFCWGV
jgi:hypothetical protein